jgi:FixJ family two-component response regulator
VPRAKPLISIIDDDELMREAIRILIKSLGFRSRRSRARKSF